MTYAYELPRGLTWFFALPEYDGKPLAIIANRTLVTEKGRIYRWEIVGDGDITYGYMGSMLI